MGGPGGAWLQSCVGTEHAPTAPGAQPACGKYPSCMNHALAAAGGAASAHPGFSETSHETPVSDEVCSLRCSFCGHKQETARKKKKKAKNGTELANWASQELRLEPNHMLVYLFLGQRRLDFIKLQAAVISHVDNQTKF